MEMENFILVTGPSHIEDTSTPNLIQLWRMNIMLDSNVELETFLLLEKKSR